MTAVRRVTSGSPCIAASEGARAGLPMLPIVAPGARFGLCRLASIGILAPFQYVEIIGAAILGLVIFNEFPDPITWLGVAIIVSSGMYVFHREAKLAASTH